MPSWWGKKSPKNRVLHPQVDESQQNHHSIKSSAAGNDTNTSKKNTRSFDEVSNTVISPNSRISPRNSRDFTTAAGGGRVSSGGSSAFSGFDSDRAHPLPRPSISSTLSTTTDYSSTGLRSGSASVSSVSSSGSSEEGGNGIHLDHIQSGFQRRIYDMKMSPRSGSRTATANTSPIHPRFSGSNLDSPTGRVEYHPLPLPPPGSPTRPPSPLSNTRTSPVIETNHLNCISKWKKGRLLGRGTFGQVYLGFNSESGQMCAIKEVKVISDDHTSRECLKQLNQEINLLSQLSHPNIVQYYGSELGEETLSVYLEYVSGGSIHKLLQEYGSFTEPVIQSYTRQILSGLAYLHGRNTVHRDIKGANILVDPNGEIKLADFGMAKHITTCSSMLSFKGSPYWMAPEVVMNMNGYSLPVDIWSLGCTILEMASSKPPWNQYEGVAAIFKIGNSKDIPEIPDHLSSDAKSFISLCLQRDPLARPSALKLLDHPFVREQGSPRFCSDGNRSPATSSRQSVTINSRPIPISREIGRTITSLPVSPCSSPLRDYGAAHKSCFLSPTHRSYGFVGQNVNSARDYHSRQPGKIYTPEPCYNRENNPFKFQTSSASPL